MTGSLHTDYEACLVYQPVPAPISLLQVMESLKFLARQGCAIQGHTEKGDGSLYQRLGLGDFRPITYLSTGYKVITGALCKVLKKHVEMHYILPDEQKELCQRRHGCLDAL